MTTVEILRRARELLSEPERWTQGEFARSSPESSKALHGNEPGATCFCALGALQCVSGSHWNPLSSYAPLATTRAARTLTRVVGRDIPSWNDDPARTHDEVLETFDRAIELAEARA